ncbi:MULTISPECIES: biotin--[acetyl-CoA-carboxylase] ligase [Acidianus]|uniref:Biotin--acetyl-CoA-carboxylase ligase n=1 Tax=Candidatus Acidianus copahuensis TaxID=1160895 RepID=A0A031LMT0_9CREN|nr:MULTISPECIES: biotin--[acetyl-CoA-carboxylase] ligase [Acidianus]EZQ03200.1 biotin--acetyl-CoA-carboxylase ligase [Candidatus Acidianus copahuensis]NON61980.1 biotin--[acetyl-CoA-carboxylase] ligase [Acidianus sp. RZ1]
MLTFRAPKITSTQDFAEAVHNMLFSDFIVIADEQTKARGRYRREWYSPIGGLWFTYAKKGIPTEKVPSLSIITSLAVRKVLSNYVDSRIRWPNDITVSDRKISGILIEAEALGNISTVFIGIGINSNVKEFPQELYATSLLLETGKNVNNDEILDRVIKSIEEYYREIDNTEKIISEVNEFLSMKERKIRLIEKDSEKKCVALFVDRYGRLVTDCGIFEAEDVLRVEVI